MAISYCSHLGCKLKVVCVPCGQYEAVASGTCERKNAINVMFFFRMILIIGLKCNGFEPIAGYGTCPTSCRLLNDG